MRLASKIKRELKRSKNIFVMAHKNLDLDALGACIGVSAIASNFKKQSYIIVDDKKHEPAVGRVLKEITNSIKIISSSEISKYHYNKSILVIVDTNKRELLQNSKILKLFNKVIILDHHQETDQTIKESIRIINENASSACEIVTNLIDKFKVKISAQLATFILAGIVLDTNNFVVKTSAKTYKAAYYLASQGANPKKVQYFLKQDIKDYIIRQKVITEVKVINNKYALSVAPEQLKYKREELAKIADTLLQFNKIEASFVIGNRIDGCVGLSARSDGTFDVGALAEKLGGGGDKYDAAAQINDKSLEEVSKELLELLD